MNGNLIGEYHPTCPAGILAGLLADFTHLFNLIPSMQHSGYRAAPSGMVHESAYMRRTMPEGFEGHGKWVLPLKSKQWAN
jgi:hypothetical protein